MPETTTDPVTAAVESLRRADECRCPKCEEGRNADAAEITAELTRLRALVETLAEEQAARLEAPTDVAALVAALVVTPTDKNK